LLEIGLARPGLKSDCTLPGGTFTLVLLIRINSVCPITVYHWKKEKNKAKKKKKKKPVGSAKD